MIKKKNKKEKQRERKIVKNEHSYLCDTLDVSEMGIGIEIRKKGRKG